MNPEHDPTTDPNHVLYRHPSPPPSAFAYPIPPALPGAPPDAVPPVEGRWSRSHRGYLDLRWTEGAAGGGHWEGRVAVHGQQLRRRGTVPDSLGGDPGEAREIGLLRLCEQLGRDLAIRLVQTGAGR